MEIHAHARGVARRRFASLRLRPFVLLAGGLALGLPAAGLAQVTFTSGATAAYNLSGRILQHGLPEANFTDVKSLSTNNPLAQPVQLDGSIGGTLANAGGSATLSTNVTATGAAGLMRAAIEGSTSASWTGNQSVAGLSPSSVTVSWTDAFILLGNPANPQPGRVLLVQSFLNVSGNMQYTLTDPALEFGNQPGFSFASMSLNLSAHDHAGRSLIAGSEFAAERGGTRPDVQETIHVPPPGIVPVTLQVIEGQVNSMRFEMLLRANAGSGTGSQYFGADSTATTFNADFSHTLSWGGITSVTDFTTGQPVPGWSITSASGANYANAIPEPTSLALLALAAPALLRRKLPQTGTRYPQ